MVLVHHKYSTHITKRLWNIERAFQVKVLPVFALLVAIPSDPSLL